jgi:hypothetical protein
MLFQSKTRFLHILRSNCRYDKARAIFDALFGVKFHKTFGRTIRDSSSTCGTGLFPSNDHKSAVGRGEQAVWADGIDVLLLMAEECDLKCQSDPQKEYKKDSFEKSAGNKPGTSSSGTGGAGSSSAKKQDNYIVAPVKGDALFLNVFL